MMPTSTDKLVAALVSANAPPEMIAKAKANHYHDYKSTHPTPCIELANDLAEALKTNPALEAVRVRAIRGDFDASKAESDEWAASPEGRAILGSLGPIGLTFPPTR